MAEASIVFLIFLQCDLKHRTVFIANNVYILGARWRLKIVFPELQQRPDSAKHSPGYCFLLAHVLLVLISGFLTWLPVISVRLC